jgi:hypothetical protein
MTAAAPNCAAGLWGWPLPVLPLPTGPPPPPPPPPPLPPLPPVTDAQASRASRGGPGAPTQAPAAPAMLQVGSSWGPTPPCQKKLGPDPRSCQCAAASDPGTPQGPPGPQAAPSTLAEGSTGRGGAAGRSGVGGPGCQAWLLPWCAARLPTRRCCRDPGRGGGWPRSSWGPTGVGVGPATGSPRPAAEGSPPRPSSMTVGTWVGVEEGQGHRARPGYWSPLMQGTKLNEGTGSREKVVGGWPGHPPKSTPPPPCKPLTPPRHTRN